jgi:acetylornithine deacetylase/succinyl-diaminopimelate desuccinylase-like protein
MRRDGPSVVELLQQLIRNRCVSAGFPSTGEEIRNAELLRDVVAGPGVETAIVTPAGGRPSLVARIDGSDSAAASLCLAAHTDVVAAQATEWERDPFGGELVDSEVWGRGAVDMLGQAAAMAVTVRTLADAGFRPRGTLIFVAAPDEECGGRAGMKPLLEQYAELARADFAVTEVGGAVRRTSAGPLIEGYASDKGAMAVIITVRGTSAHTMMPYGVDNALVKAAQVVQRVADYQPPAKIVEEWRTWVSHQDLGQDITQLLTDPDRLDAALPGLPADLARQAHACTHTVMVPVIVQGADRINLIPGTINVGIGVRTLPGDDHQAVLEELRLLLRDLVDPSDVVIRAEIPPTRSTTQTPLWRLLEQITATHYPGGRLVPTLLTAQTDARYLRPAGTVTYGFALYSASMTPDAYWSRFHGANERIDIASLDLATTGYEEICRGFLR